MKVGRKRGREGERKEKDERRARGTEGGRKEGKEIRRKERKRKETEIFNWPISDVSISEC